MNALEAKRVQLGLPSPAQAAPEATPFAGDDDARSVSVVISNHNGLHVRPASRLVAALAYNPFAIGIGQDEDTAAFISPDDVLEVEGSGAVTVVDAHEILVLDAGQIVERGHHQQLLALNGRYASMWALQQQST